MAVAFIRTRYLDKCMFAGMCSAETASEASSRASFARGSHPRRSSLRKRTAQNWSSDSNGHWKQATRTKSRTSWLMVWSSLRRLVAKLNGGGQKQKRGWLHLHLQRGWKTRFRRQEPEVKTKRLRLRGGKI